VAVLFSAGDQEPVMPLFEVVGSGLSAAPSQIGATEEKVGTVPAITVTLSEANEAH
jgi:hypothetical protein